MSQVTEILLRDFDNAQDAAKYARHIARMAQLNGNAKMAEEYESAARYLDALPGKGWSCLLDGL